MCGLFGVLKTKESKISDKEFEALVKALANSSQIRGTDATGISFVDPESGKLVVDKSPTSADKFKFNLPKNVSCVLGHTRLATLGDPKVNANNHPHKGYTKGGAFAVTHNGVISNHRELSKMFELKKTKIETDSYVVVQLLGRDKRKIDSGNIQSVVELLEGSVALAILDQSGDLYLVKGNNPLFLVELKEFGVFVYTSTKDIFIDALLNSEFDSVVDRALFEGSNELSKVGLRSGQILKISVDGSLEYTEFDMSRLNNGFGYYSYTFMQDNEFEPLALYELADDLGIPYETIDELIGEGLSVDEVIEFIEDIYWFEGDE